MTPEMMQMVLDRLQTSNRELRLENSKLKAENAVLESRMEIADRNYKNTATWLRSRPRTRQLVQLIHSRIVAGEDPVEVLADFLATWEQADG